MKKTAYQNPEIEIIVFTQTDVMLASGNKGYQSDPFDGNPFDGGEN